MCDEKKFTITDEPLDRRNSLRCLLFVNFCLRYGDDQYIGVTEDLSLGGAYLNQTEPVLTSDMEGEGCRLSLKMPNRTLMIKCKILHVSKKGAGVMFYDMDDATKSIIKTIIINRL
ncbi:MAG: PilZ domain-containing protein [Methylococcales bacterium]|jgi:hypothetical protein|nr:PilZ domain-containing protein [Methylococcales bacterium]MBT7409735.1 PilZ domain-containing protein [Methylococcales bacterium]